MKLLRIPTFIRNIAQNNLNFGNKEATNFNKIQFSGTPSAISDNSADVASTSFYHSLRSRPISQRKRILVLTTGPFYQRIIYSSNVTTTGAGIIFKTRSIWVDGDMTIDHVLTFLPLVNIDTAKWFTPLTTSWGGFPLTNQELSLYWGSHIFEAGGRGDPGTIHAGGIPGFGGTIGQGGTGTNAGGGGGGFGQDGGDGGDGIGGPTVGASGGKGFWNLAVDVPGKPESYGGVGGTGGGDGSTSSGGGGGGGFGGGGGNAPTTGSEGGAGGPFITIVVRGNLTINPGGALVAVGQPGFQGGSDGGGGGGGGCFIILVLGDFNNNGFINVSGGNGGNVSGSGGGGGGGGHLEINGRLVSTGTLIKSGGAGGTGANPGFAGELGSGGTLQMGLTSHYVMGGRRGSILDDRGVRWGQLWKYADGVW